MREIDQAYEILGLNRGASLRQVDEAYRDLRDLWNPERFRDNPRLRAQATEKRNSVEEAYETIIESLSSRTRQKPSPSDEKRPITGPAASSDQTQPSANLFEDAFSDRISESKRIIPVWAIMFFIVLAGLFLSYLALSTTSERTEAIRAAAHDEEESELTKLVEQVRGRYSESNGEQKPLDAPEPVPQPEKAPEVKREAPISKPVPKVVASENVRRDPVTVREEKKSQERQAQVTAPQPQTKPQEPPSSDLDRPVLIRDEISSEEETAVETTNEGPPDEHMEVLRVLMQGSATASKLVKGQIGTLNFSEWSIIQETASETWIDLVATWTSGQEVHFFWSVNPTSGAVRPLNQAARNLESSVGSP